MDVRVERDTALKHAYGFAKSGNATWAQLWIDRANSFFPVSERQLAYAQKCFDKCKETGK
jgi:hypothetical protein